MIMILKIVISAVAYLILAPFAGGLLTGMGAPFFIRVAGKERCIDDAAVS